MKNKEAVLTITEDEVDFGKGGLDEKSFVHKVALFAVEKINEALKDDD